MEEAKMTKRKNLFSDLTISQILSAIIIPIVFVLLTTPNIVTAEIADFIVDGFDGETYDFFALLMIFVIIPVIELIIIFLILIWLFKKLRKRNT